MAKRYMALVRALVRPMQKIEDAIIELFHAMLLRNATGKLLEDLGKLVGQAPRGTMSEADYREILMVRTKVNRSYADFRDLKKIILAFVDTVKISSGGGVGFIDIGPQPLAKAQQVYDFLIRAIETTVRLQVYYQPSPEDETFTLALAAITLGPITGGAVLVNGAQYMPDHGTVFVGVGTALEETATYISKDENHLYGLTTVNNHQPGTAIQLTNDPDLGFGDADNPGTGGHLASIIGS